MKKLLASLLLGLGLLATGPLALAQAPATAEPAAMAAPAETAAAPDAMAAPAPAAPVVTAEAAPVAPKLDSGDTAWMLTSTLLVILMTIPGLALFYGGLARSKNMLSVLVQVFVIFACCGHCTATAWRSPGRASSSAGWTSCSSRASHPTLSRVCCPPFRNTCSWPSSPPLPPLPWR